MYVCIRTASRPCRSSLPPFASLTPLAWGSHRPKPEDALAHDWMQDTRMGLPPIAEGQISASVSLKKQSFALFQGQSVSDASDLCRQS